MSATAQLEVEDSWVKNRERIGKRDAVPSSFKFCMGIGTGGGGGGGGGGKGAGPGGQGGGIFRICDLENAANLAKKTTYAPLAKTSSHTTVSGHP